MTMRQRAERRYQTANHNEERLQRRVDRLNKQLEASKLRKRGAEVEKETESLLTEADRRMDARGREIYGDAWEEGAEEGILPLKDLFQMPQQDINEVQSSARL